MQHYIFGWINFSDMYQMVYIHKRVLICNTNQILKDFLI